MPPTFRADRALVRPAPGSRFCRRLVTTCVHAQIKIYRGIRCSRIIFFGSNIQHAASAVGRGIGRLILTFFKQRATW